MSEEKKDNQTADSAADTEETAQAKDGQDKPAANRPARPARPAVELTEEEKAAKAAASAEKRARAAAARAKKAEETPAEEKPPSVNQPMLDEAVRLIQENVSPQAVEASYINELNEDMPTIVIRNEHWIAAAETLRDHPSLRLNYLRNVTGVDEEQHMEVVYYLVSLENRKKYCVKVKTNREQPTVFSATPIWSTANWNEREIYDLLGIDFPGHPDLRRIMLSDDWVGHPLRKDYVPIDPEV